MIFQRYFPERTGDEPAVPEKKILRHSLFFSLLLLIIIWLVFLFELTYQFDFSRLGIYPRSLKGLTGILTSPFIHGSLSHISANSLPLFTLSLALFYFYRSLSYPILFSIYLLSGICVWIGGREAWHIGASGLIYGLASFLIFSGIIRNDVRLLTISLIVILLYGGLFWGIFPIWPEISWESHLWGSVSGFILALVFRNNGPVNRSWNWEEDKDDEMDESVLNQDSEVDNPQNEDQMK